MKRLLNHAAERIWNWPTAILLLVLCVSSEFRSGLYAQQFTTFAGDNQSPESLIDRIESASDTDVPLLRRSSALSDTPIVPQDLNWIQVQPESTPPRFKLRGRIDTDFLWSNQTAANEAIFGDLGDPIGFRRARIGAEGHLSLDSRYVAEIDLATGEVVIRDIYFGLGQVKDTGEVRFGHMREPFSLEGGTSANSYAFMERSPANVFDPARNWGIGFTRCSEHEMGTVAGGVFQAGTDTSDFQYGPGSTTGITLRATGLAWYEQQGRQLMHFGMAISDRFANQGVISVSQKPNSPLLDVSDSTESPFVPKIRIAANFQQLINLQWAYVSGPFWTQAEWYGSIIDQKQGGPVFYHGSYLDVGYFLTGEHRHYLTQTGFFGPVLVNHPVVSGFTSRKTEEELGSGAWETIFRFSYLDTISDNAPLGANGLPAGTRLPQITVGVNWYLADQLRLMFDYSYVWPQEAGGATTTADVLGMRLAVFW